MTYWFMSTGVESVVASVGAHARLTDQWSPVSCRTVRAIARPTDRLTGANCGLAGRLLGSARPVACDRKGFSEGPAAGGRSLGPRGPVTLRVIAANRLRLTLRGHFE